MSSRNVACKNCEWNIGRAVEQKEKLCDEVETVRESTYHVDRKSASEGCEVAGTARTMHRWDKLREYGVLMY